MFGVHCGGFSSRHSEEGSIEYTWIFPREMTSCPVQLQHISVSTHPGIWVTINAKGMNGYSWTNRIWGF